MDSRALEPAGKPIVALVDDEPQVRSFLISALAGLDAELLPLGSLAEFRAALAVSEIDCAIVDLRLPDGSGLDAAAEVRAQGDATALILVSGYASVRVAVQAVQEGMIDVLEKPFSPADVRAGVERGVALCRERRSEARRRQEARERLALLSESEKDVLGLVLGGAPNKVIARSLGMGLRTVESRKAQLYGKLHAESMAELIQAAWAGGFEAKSARSRTPQAVVLAAG